MLLVLTNEQDTTADLVVHSADRRGMKLARINTERLVDSRWQVAPDAFRIRFGAHDFTTKDIRGIWYRRPEAPHFPVATPLSAAEESLMFQQWADLIDGLESIGGYAWMSRPTALRRAENKILQLRSAKHAGFSIPETWITNSADEDLARFRAQHDGIVVKTLSGSHIEGDPDRFIFTNLLTKPTQLDPEALSIAPMVFQRRLTARRHLRLTVVGRRTFAAEIFPQNMSANSIDWRSSVSSPKLNEAAVPDAVRASAAALVHEMGLLFSTMDIVVEGEEYFFLDLNPNGEWAWIERGAGLPISDAILDELS